MSSFEKEVIAIELPGAEFARVVGQRSALPHRVHYLDPAFRGFCKFCGRQTEYAIANQSVRVFKYLKNGVAKAVPLTDEMRTKAQKFADDLVALYEEAIAGKHGPFKVGELLHKFGDMRDMGGDSSVAAFRDHVERRALITEWAKHGDVYSVPAPTGLKGAQRPSKLYCDLHNPGRGIEARRAYQRDRRFLAEYEEVIRQLWSACAGRLRRWNIDDEAMVRHAAYHSARVLKAPTRFLDEYSETIAPSRSRGQARISHANSIEDYHALARASYHILRDMMKGSKDWLDELREIGITNQAEVARKLGVRRQAVSAALKKRKGSGPY